MENTPTRPHRILVRGTNWLGDAVMTTPALLRLREKFPRAIITLLTPDKLVDLWLNHPALDEVIPFAPDQGLFSVASRLRVGSVMKLLESRQEGTAAGRAAYQEIAKSGGTLAQAVVQVAKGSSKNSIVSALPDRNQTFDLALVLPNSPRSALEVFLARIPQRVGYARPWRNFFLTRTVASRPEAVTMRKRSVSEIRAAIISPPEHAARVTYPAGAHQIHEYLHLAAALGANPEPVAPLLLVTPQEVDAARKKFGLAIISGPLFGLNPGAEYGPAKRWPVERFIAAAKEIQSQTNCVWLLFGGKSDAAITGQIAAALQASRLAHHNLSGRTTLRELMALLKLCRVLLTNDTGPMHVAAALGTPVVVPFGSTSPELTGPGLPGDSDHRLLKSHAPCSPCFLRECPIDFRCMTGISVAAVVAALHEAAVLPQPPPSQRPTP